MSIKLTLTAKLNAHGEANATNDGSSHMAKPSSWYN